MKHLRLILVISLILSIAFYSIPAFAAPAAATGDFGDPGEADYVPNRLVVKFRPGTDAATKQQVHSRHGGTVTGEIAGLGVEIVNVKAGRIPDHARAYRSEKAVEYAEPDYVAHAFEVAPDPDYGKQWGMSVIQAPAAWQLSDGSGVAIAILDTGIDTNHPDLAAKIVTSKSKDFTGKGSYEDGNGHGTHVAGIAAAVTNNGVGVAGVGNASSIISVKVLDDSGSGAYTWIADGIKWSADSGARVINMSLGARYASSLLESAINYAWSKNVIIVASAGNNGNSRPNYPAYYAPCIAVASTTSDDSKSSFSTYGDWVDVAAPGSTIWSTLPNHTNSIGLDYGYLSGTSMASPHVAGLAALVWDSAYGTGNSAVRSRIEQTAEQTGSIWNSYGIPRISAVQAVDPGYAVTEPLVLSNLAIATTVSSAKLTWTTNVPATTRVDFGLTTLYDAADSPYSDTALTMMHSVDLTGLNRATTYYYKITSVAGSETVTTTGSFKTKRK